eukprot:scaffold5086_cov73-Phaeocystis_antarctica.AAC.1
MSCVTRDTQSYVYLSIHPSQTWSAGVGRVGRHTPRLLVSILVNRERVGERGTAGGRGLGRPFDFERAYAHSNDVFYQVSPPVALTHTLPLLYPPRCLTPTMCSTRETVMRGCASWRRLSGGSTSWNACAHRRGQCAVLHHGAVTENGALYFFYHPSNAALQQSATLPGTALPGTDDTRRVPRHR